MAAALARPLTPALTPDLTPALTPDLAPADGHRRGGLAPVALGGRSPVAPGRGPRHARPVDVLDLDAVWRDATAPHRVAAARDAHVAEVVWLDEVRARRAAAPRVLRHRLAALLFTVGLAVVLATGAGALVADADGPTALADTVTVQPGETLWDVAVAHTADGQDPRVTLDRIRDLNGLNGNQVPAWTAVVLPASLD